MEIASPNVGAGMGVPCLVSWRPAAAHALAFANGSLLIPDFGKLEEGTPTAAWLPTVSWAAQRAR